MLNKEIYQKLSEAIPEYETWGGDEFYGPNHRFLELKNSQKILFCVTATDAVVKYAKDLHYDLIISHHPFVIDFPQLVFHTALDCCAGGNNDIWRDMLGIKNAKHWDKNLGYIGEVDPITPNDLRVKIESFIRSPILGKIECKTDVIKTVLVVTGLGGLVWEHVMDTDVDCYVTGQLCGLNSLNEKVRGVIETGHTLSEQCGVKTIRQILGPSVTVDLCPIELDIFGREIGG